MKPEIAQKWIEALRSGSYSQTTRKLKNDTSYCCLGVLCDLASKEGIGEWKAFHDRECFYVTDQDKSFMALPDAVVAWAGISNSHGSFSKDEDNLSPDCLAALNDDGATFEQIAKIIQEKVEVL